ncbi:MAG: tetratricopeptide repeat protein [Smithellaceae bacterium]
METMVYKTANRASELMRRIDECRKHLVLNNLFSCIASFREILDDFINRAILSEAERISVTSSLNDLQQKLTNSQQFKDIYGAVTFRDDDFRTSYEFIGQLIQIKEDEIANVLIGKEVAQLKASLDELTEEEQQKTLTMVSLVERGEQMVLRQLVSENDELASLVLTYYNDNGVTSRAAGDVNKAIQEYKKALFVSPDDEHLLYNLARAYIEIGDKQNAEENIRLALDLNPDFIEGLKLQNYINQWAP